MDLNKYLDSIEEHYKDVWQRVPSSHYWKEGPIYELPPKFKVLKFAPSPERDMWTYATCGMSDCILKNPMEIHIFTPVEQDKMVELLTVIAHYHYNIANLKLGDTVNFGEPWWQESKCEYGLISLPYLDGPTLEWLNKDGIHIQFLWLIPITKQEVNYKKLNGLDSLEELFDNPSFNYVNPFRDSLV